MKISLEGTYSRMKLRWKTWNVFIVKVYLGGLKSGFLLD